MPWPSVIPNFVASMLSLTAAYPKSQMVTG
nr:MAG TPA: hypothetical protein [Caudoviricetes sp.]